MPRCPNCGRRLEHAVAECSRCQSQDERLSPSFAEADSPASACAAETDARRVMIARFQNGAEAGYFADELYRTTGIETEVMAREHFDAVHAAWSIDYLLLASASEASQGAQALRTLVEDSEDRAEQTCPPEQDRNELSSGMWMPLILTLAAGSIACWGVERAEQRPRPPALVDRDPRAPPDLWHILGATSGPWLQKGADGVGARELTVDPDRQTVLLREDHDGDGTFDREWHFDWRK